MLFSGVDTGIDKGGPGGPGPPMAPQAPQWPGKKDFLLK